MAPMLTMPEQGLNGPCCRLERGIRAIGADGLTVEVHPAPEKAISDGAQSLGRRAIPKNDEGPGAIHSALAGVTEG